MKTAVQLSMGSAQRNSFQFQIAGNDVHGVTAVGIAKLAGMKFECTNSIQLGCLRIIGSNRNSLPYRLTALSVTVESPTVESGKETGKICCEFRANVTTRCPTARKKTPINKDINSLWQSLCLYPLINVHTSISPLPVCCPCSSTYTYQNC
jgi:hypothetical protein